MIKPTQDRVLLKPIDTGDKSDGGIYIPENAAERRFGTEGIVVAVGPGLRNERGKLMPIEEVKVGDRVMYPRFSGHEIRHEGEKYIRIGVNELLAVVNS